MHRATYSATICGAIRVFTHVRLNGFQGKPVVVGLFCGGGGDCIVDQTSAVVPVVAPTNKGISKDRTHFVILEPHVAPENHSFWHLGPNSPSEDGREKV